MKRVVFHRLAAAELVESALFYDRKRAGLGDRFISAVDAVLELIRSHPGLGRRGPLATFSVRTRRFPFHVVYELQPDRIWIVAMAHLSRKPDYWVRRATRV